MLVLSETVLVLVIEPEPVLVPNATVLVPSDLVLVLSETVLVLEPEPVLVLVLVPSEPVLAPSNPVLLIEPGLFFSNVVSIMTFLST